MSASPSHDWRDVSYDHRIPVTERGSTWKCSRCGSMALHKGLPPDDIILYTAGGKVNSCDGAVVLSVQGS